MGGDWIGGSDDADDMAMTLASIRSSEIQHSKEIEMPQVSVKNYNETGNKIENILSKERRISTQELAAAEADDDEDKFKKSEFRKKQEQHDRQLKDMQAKREKVMSAEEEMNVHFEFDDIRDDE